MIDGNMLYMYKTCLYKKFYCILFYYSCIIQILCRKKISVLIDLKVSSLTNKRVFYRLERNAKRNPIEFNF